MKRQTVITLVVSIIAGALIWAVSPVLAGQTEAWDASGHYYLIALVVAGGLSGLLTPRPLWALYLGAYIGQGAYMVLFLPSGPLMPIGLVLLLVTSLLFFGAAVLGSLARKGFQAPEHNKR